MPHESLPGPIKNIANEYESMEKEQIVGIVSKNNNSKSYTKNMMELFSNFYCMNIIFSYFA